MGKDNPISKGVGIGIGIVIGLILMVALIAGCTGFFLTNNPPSLTTSTNIPNRFDLPVNPTTETVVPSTSKTSQTVNLKEDVKIDDITYKIISSKKTTNIGTGNEYYSQDFWADGIFVIVRFSVRNDKEIPLAFRNYLKLKDENGNFYVARADTPYWLNYYDDLDYKTLQPKIATIGSMLFDVPPSAKGLSVVIEGSNKVVYVLLPEETQS